MAFKGAPVGKGEINSEPIQTKVGTSQTNVFTATSTKVTQGNDGKVNGGLTTLYYSNKPDNYVPAATTKDGGKTWTYLKDSSGKNVLGADAINSLKSGALKNNTQAQIVSSSTKASVPKEDRKNLADSEKNKSNSPTGGDQQGGATNQDIVTALKDVKARTDYERSLVYPIGLQLEYQDCIKFSVLKYSASGLNLDEASRKDRRVSLNGNIPTIVDTKDILTTITLPIPAGISDSNTVDWQSSSLDEITRGLANIAQSTISDGGPAGASAAGKEINNVSQNSAQYKSAAASKFTEAAIGANAGILQRQYGAVINPNMELLFNGPSLRTFGFTFRLSPRSQPEATIVKKIIRYFKQAMSTKRSKATLLLQAPHTFAISYLSANKQHPYLNKFKECALTSCTVNYTPDGNYSTFTDGSMTSYELQLQFQELVPLFDDDYGTDNDNIGF